MVIKKGDDIHIAVLTGRRNTLFKQINRSSILCNYTLEVLSRQGSTEEDCLKIQIKMLEETLGLDEKGRKLA